jgi:hypothetical protein
VPVQTLQRGRVLQCCRGESAVSRLSTGKKMLEKSRTLFFFNWLHTVFYGFGHDILSN